MDSDFLNKGQPFIMVSNNKISDYITGAGAFVFHSAFEPYSHINTQEKVALC